MNGRLESKKLYMTGISMGLISGVTYGIYTTLVLGAGCCHPFINAAGFLAAPYVCSGLNDLFAGIWLTLYNFRGGRICQLRENINTFPGKLLIVGSLLGGPVANGTYLIGLSMAGAYAIPISATCSLFGAIFAWIFLKQKPAKRVGVGMVICVMGAIIINWIRPEGSPHFTLGIICAFIAAISWGMEGTISTYGGTLIDPDVAVNIRELISGIIDLVVIVPAVGALELLKETFTSCNPVFWLAASGFSAAVSFLTWYKSNAIVGCAAGMSLNVTYTFWGVLFCILFLNQELTVTIILGSIVIVIGAIIVTMNPLDLFRRE